MRRLIWAALAALFLLCAPSAKSQGTRKDDTVINSQGRPVAGAAVRVCASNGSGTPCTPIASIYDDSALTVVKANPFTTDSLGNYHFYAAPGTYVIQTTVGGTTLEQRDVLLPSSVTPLLAADIGVTVPSVTGFCTPPSAAPSIATESASGGSVDTASRSYTILYFNRNGRTTASSATAFAPSAGSTNQIRVRVNDFQYRSGCYGFQAFSDNQVQKPKSYTEAVANNGFVRTSNVVTVTMGANHGLRSQQLVTIAASAGCGVSPNGTFRVKSIVSPTVFTYSQTAANDSACGGASATVFFSTGVPAPGDTAGDPSTWTGHMNPGDIIITAIGGGAPAAITNTATIDTPQVSNNGTSNYSTNSVSKETLLPGDYTLTTPLIVSNQQKIRCVGTGRREQVSGLAGGALRSTWTEPELATLIVMNANAVDIDGCEVTATASNALMLYTAGSGSNSYGGHVTIRNSSLRGTSATGTLSALNIRGIWYELQILGTYMRGDRTPILAQNHAGANWNIDSYRKDIGGPSGFISEGSPTDPPSGK